MHIELENENSFEAFFSRSLDPYVRHTTEKAESAILALVGELGAGKSTLTRYMADRLGVKEKLPSPTFLLMRKYKINPPFLGKENLIHIDAYRIHDAKEIIVLGIDSIFNDKKNLVFIEWADKVQHLIPPHARWFMMENVGEDARQITEIKK